MEGTVPIALKFVKMKNNLRRASVILVLVTLTEIITTSAQKSNSTAKPTTVEYEAPEVEQPPSNKTQKKTMTTKPVLKPAQIYVPTPIPTVSVPFNPQSHYLKPKPLPNKYVNINWVSLGTNSQKKPAGVKMVQTQTKLVSDTTKLSPISFYQPTPIPTIDVPFNPHLTGLSPTSPPDKPISIQSTPIAAENPQYRSDVVQMGLDGSVPQWTSLISPRKPGSYFANTAILSPPIYNKHQATPEPIITQIFVKSNDTVSQGLSLGGHVGFSNQNSNKPNFSEQFINKYKNRNVLGNFVPPGNTRIQRIPRIPRTWTDNKGPNRVETPTFVHGNKNMYNMKPLVLNNNKSWQRVQNKSSLTNQTVPIWTRNNNNSLQTQVNSVNKRPQIILSMKQTPGTTATFKFKPLLSPVFKPVKDTITTTQTPITTASKTAPMFKWFNTITTTAPPMYTDMWGFSPHTTQFFTIMPTSTTPATHWQSTSSGFNYRSSQLKNIHQQRQRHHRIQDPYLSFALEIEKLHRELHNPMYPMSMSKTGVSSAFLNSKSSLMSSLLEFV